MENKVRTYETICLTKVDMPEDKFNALVERCKNAVAQEGKGEWLMTDDWGKSKIAYTIGKDNRAKWTYFRFKSLPAGVDELQRGLKINEFVLRQQTVRASEDGADYTTLRPNMAKDLADRERPQEWRDSRPNRGGPRGGGRWEDRRGSSDDRRPDQNAEAFGMDEEDGESVKA